MKKTLFIIAVLLVTLCGVVACAKANASEQNNEPKVYVCTGKYAKKYHRWSDCKGLGNCKGTIRLMPISTAKKQGRTPCGYCY